MPPDVEEAGTRAEIQAVNDSPSLALEWNSYVLPGVGMAVDVTVSNWGDAPASDMIGQVDVETPGGDVVAQGRSTVPDIPAGRGVETTVEVTPPTDQSLRLRVGAISGDVLQDMNVTEYQSP